ncbi:MAG: hypothetical protein WCP29_08515 [Acidobacteriota bacterium]
MTRFILTALSAVAVLADLGQMVFAQQFVVVTLPWGQATASANGSRYWRGAR